MKQRVQPIFFTAPIAGHSHENVAAHQSRKRHGGAYFGKQTRAGVQLDAIKQSDPHEKLLNLRLFLREYFFGKVFEDVSLRLAQHSKRIDMFLIHAGQSLPLSHLPD